MFFSRKNFLIALGLITLFRLWFVWLGPFDLSPDEAHYWDWSRRLDLSYYSKGPGIAYVIAFFSAIFGSSTGGVRTGAVVAAIITTIVLYELTYAVFKSERAAFIAALTPSVTPLFAAGSILMTIDAPFIMLWALAIWSFRKALVTERPVWWYAAGAAVGLGILAKYTMAIILPAFLLAILLIEDDRKWLKRKEPYLAVTVSFVLSLPIIIWNHTHGWVTIRHFAGQTHIKESGGINFSSGLEFIGSQIGVVSPVIVAVIIAAAVISGMRGVREKNRGLVLLFAASIPVLVLFILKAFHAKVQANWGAPAYFTAFAAIGVFDGMLDKNTGSRWAKPVFIAGLALGFMLTAVMHFPGIAKAAGVKDVEKQSMFSRVIGWREMGAKTKELKDSFGQGAEVFIFSDSYQTASELAFYTPGHPVVYNAFVNNRRMNQYDIWGGFEALVGMDAVYVRTGDKPLDAVVAAAFGECAKEPVFSVYRGETKVKDFSFFKCYGFKGFENKRPFGAY